MSSRLSCWLHGHRWGQWDGAYVGEHLWRRLLRPLVRPVRGDGQEGCMTRLEDVLAVANELAEAIIEGPTPGERETLWRYARAHVELRLTLAAGEPVGDPGHSVRVAPDDLVGSAGDALVGKSDALGERDGAEGRRADAPAATPPAIRKDAGPSCSPSALSGRDGTLHADGGTPEPAAAQPGRHTGPPRPPNALRLVGGDA